ncbi:UNVERIFIED_CONTAM: hypothetical protein RMT77_016182 [Armadillidium vulgare]
MRPWAFLTFLVVILALASTSPVPDWSDELFYYGGPNAANRLVRNRNIAATGTGYLYRGPYYDSFSHSHEFFGK